MPHQVIAADLVENQLIDMPVFGRTLLADPDLPNKAKAGKLDQIRPCNSCQDCVDSTMRGGGSACALNPRTGREAQIPLRTSCDTANPKCSRQTVQEESRHMCIIITKDSQVILSPPTNILQSCGVLKGRQRRSKWQ